LIDYGVGGYQSHSCAVGIGLSLPQLCSQHTGVHAGDDLSALDEIAFLQQHCLDATGQLGGNVDFCRLQSPIGGYDARGQWLV
jgi:hypothetical protein